MDNNIQETQSTDTTPPASTPTPVAATPVQNKKLSTKAIVAIIVSSVTLLLIISGLVMWAVLARQTRTQNDTTISTTNTSHNSDNSTSDPKMSYMNSIRLSTRDVERKTDINFLANQLEVQYAQNGGYPTLSDVNNKAWRLANNFKTGDDDQVLIDPLSPNNTTLNAKVPTTTTGGYTYKPAPTGCVSASDAKGELVNAVNYCSNFTLTALLENTSDKEKDPSSTSTQTFYMKKSANDF